MQDDMVVIRRRDDAYPQRLREIAKPPDELFVRGDLSLLDPPFGVGVVGTRRMTSYGRAVIRAFVPEWVRAGAVIVSGLAYGIDAEAHAAALDAGGGTVAVLASGIDDACVSPKGNVRLARRMLEERGAIVSEYPPGTPAMKHRFPERNRIVAALSRCTVVAEAPRSSGALITAYAALDAGRDVFAVPGAVTSPMSVGANRLIARGAYPLTCAADLLEHYGVASGPGDSAPAPDGDAAVALAAVADGATTPDAIAAVAGLSPAAVSAAVAELEMAGTVSFRNGEIILEIDSAAQRRLL